MSSTRYADPDAPLSQEKYLSSPEFGELPGINGTATAARVAILRDDSLKRLIWFVQGLSLQEHRLDPLADWLSKKGWGDVPTLKKFLVELCISPRCEFISEGEVKERRNRESAHIARQASISARIEAVRTAISDGMPLPEIKLLHSATQSKKQAQQPAQASAHERIIQEIAEFKTAFEKGIESQFVFTATARKIWRTLDDVLATRDIRLLQGREGIGKTEAVKAWFRCHLDRARYVSLSGWANRNAALGDIGRASCLACGPNRKAAEILPRVERFYERSGLMLLLDEFHFALEQSPRVYSRPALVDWVVTMNNHSVPFGLIATPHFLKCMFKTAAQTDWNWKQFRRRAKLVALERNPLLDIEKVARHIFAPIGEAAVNVAMSYATAAGRDVSALGDLMTEATKCATRAERTKVTVADLKAAREELTESDIAFKAAEDAAKPAKKLRRKLAAPDDPDAEQREADAQAFKRRDALETEFSTPHRTLTTTAVVST